MGGFQGLLYNARGVSSHLWPFSLRKRLWVQLLVDDHFCGGDVLSVTVIVILFAPWLRCSLSYGLHYITDDGMRVALPALRRSFVYIYVASACHACVRLLAISFGDSKNYCLHECIGLRIVSYHTTLATCTVNRCCLAQIDVCTRYEASSAPGTGRSVSIPPFIFLLGHNKLIVGGLRHSGYKPYAWFHL